MIGRRGRTVSTHGYAGYGNGCRCQTCKDAKAAYMSEKRTEATKNAMPGQPVDGAKHGTRVAYKDHGCRCSQCVEVMRAIWRGWSQAQRQHAVAGGEAP
jgi:hypothetical protein